MKNAFFLLLFFPLFLDAQDGFDIPREQYSLVTKHTATWCPPCGGTAWDVFDALVDQSEDKSVFLSAHISPTSKLYSQTAVTLIRNFDVSFGQPEFYLNTKRIGSGSGNTQSDMANGINEAAGRSPVAQTGIVASYDEITNRMTVRTRTRFFQEAEGEYALSIFLVEREVTAEQASRSPNALHKRVLRTNLTEAVMGETIASGAVSSGATFDLNKTIIFPSNISVNKAQIVTVLWKRNNNVYEIVNANKTSTIQTDIVSSSKEVELRKGFSVLPNVVYSQAWVRFSLPDQTNRLELALFDVTGKKVSVVQTGNFPEGAHEILLNRPAGISPGVYFLRLSTENLVAGRKVIFE